MTARRPAAAAPRAESRPEPIAGPRGGALTHPRRVPTQRRSRERVERILSVARALIADHGSEVLRMSDVAGRAGISIGSLYQYFPDRGAIVRTLAERYNAEGQACTAAELAGVHRPSELAPALERVIDGYYAMFRAEPAMRELWSATQADRALQDVDAEDVAVHSALLHDALRRIRPDADDDALAIDATLTMQLLAGAVRLAISMAPAQGDAVVAAFKRLVLADLARRIG